MVASPVSTQTVNLNILPRPHSQGQYEVVMGDYQIGVALCGRRWGKTLAGVERLLVKGILTPGLYWWVGLSWKSASMKRAWRLLQWFTRKVWEAAGGLPDHAIRQVEREVRLPNGLEIWLRTAENLASLSGEGVRGMVVDEFTLMQERAWTEYLRQTLLDYGGWALLCGVPKGMNWGARLWYSVAEMAGGRQWHFPTYDNPLLNTAAIDRMRDELPDLMFRQEILAEIIEGGLVVRNVRGCTYEGEQQPRPDATYVMGVDWAQSSDWTVLVVMDAAQRRVVAVDRFNQVAWEVQRGRLAALAAQWHVRTILAEANSIGGVNIEALQSEGLPVVGFTTTNESKERLVMALILAFERGDIAIPDNPVLIAELESLEATRLPSGRWRYAAPAGMHDDCAIALGLAYQAALEMSQPLVLATIEAGGDDDGW